MCSLDDTPDPSIAMLRDIAAQLERLGRDADRLTWLDRQERIMLHYEEGDPDVGVFGTWVAVEWRPDGTRPIVGHNGSLRELLDDLRTPQVTEAQQHPKAPTISLARTPQDP